MERDSYRETVADICIWIYSDRYNFYFSKVITPSSIYTLITKAALAAVRGKDPFIKAGQEDSYEDDGSHSIDGGDGGDGGGGTGDGLDRMGDGGSEAKQGSSRNKGGGGGRIRVRVRGKASRKKRGLDDVAKSSEALKEALARNNGVRRGGCSMSISFVVLYISIVVLYFNVYINTYVCPHNSLIMVYCLFSQTF